MTHLENDLLSLSTASPVAGTFYSGRRTAAYFATAVTVLLLHRCCSNVPIIVSVRRDRYMLDVWYYFCCAILRARTVLQQHITSRMMSGWGCVERPGGVDGLTDIIVVHTYIYTYM